LLAQIWADARMGFKFDWSALRIYAINVEGMKHGILLGLNRWTPQPEPLTQ